MKDYDVYSPFDLEKHREKYCHYLEVIITADGAIHYAVPSHQEWAIAAACEKLGVSRKELCDMTPPRYYLDWLTWLLGLTGAMAVWDTHYICEEPTKAQYAALRRLKLGCVYHGKLPRMKASQEVLMTG